MVKFNDCDLYINEKKVSFEREIYKILELDTGVVVLTLAFLTPGNIDEQNVYFVNLDGTIKWQIQHMGLAPEVGYQGYTAMRYRDGILEVYSFLGATCKVDLQTGKVYDCVGER